MTNQNQFITTEVIFVELQRRSLLANFSESNNYFTFLFFNRTQNNNINVESKD